jgi:hypothetical protein
MVIGRINILNGIYVWQHIEILVFSFKRGVMPMGYLFNIIG